MKYQFQDKKKIKNKKQVVSILLLVIFFVGLFYFGFVSGLGGFFSTIGTPFWKAKNVIVDRAYNTSYLIRTKSSVFNENDSLQKQIADLNLKMIDYALLKSENDQLKDLLGHLPENRTFILSAVLAKPNRSPYDTLIIDVGSNNDIREGAHVFASGNVPIGQVTTVHDMTSVVTLYSSPEHTFDAELSSSNTTVVLTGRGGGNFEMSIPLELNAEKDSFVVIPGIHPLVVAIVEDIISKPTDPLKRILLRSPVNIAELKWVQVEK